MNPLHSGTVTGTLGELLVQLRLLQYGVQAAPPLKDSGNDLIAVRDQSFRSVQIKTTFDCGKRLSVPRNRDYHILAFVMLILENGELLLDESQIYLIDKNLIDTQSYSVNQLEPFKINQSLIDCLFSA